MKIAVLGSGSWGTALGQVLAENGHEVVLWGREDHIADEINQAHTNSHFLPGINLPTTIVATTDLKAALDQAAVLLFVLPTKAIRSVAQTPNPSWCMPLKGWSRGPICGSAR